MKDTHNHQGNIWSFIVQITPRFKVYRCTYCTKAFEVAR